MGAQWKNQQPNWKEGKAGRECEWEGRWKVGVGRREEWIHLPKRAEEKEKTN